MSKGNNNTKVELRIGSVNEILSERPGWILRWGSAILLTAVAASLFVLSNIEFRNRISVPVMIHLDTLTASLHGKTEIPSYIPDKKLSGIKVKIEFSCSEQNITLQEFGSKIFTSENSGVSSNGFVLYTFSIPVPDNLSLENYNDSKIITEGNLSFCVKISLVMRFKNFLNRN